MILGKLPPGKLPSGRLSPTLTLTQTLTYRELVGGGGNLPGSNFPETKFFTYRAGFKKVRLNYYLC